MAGSVPVAASLAARATPDCAASISADRAAGISEVGAQGDVDLAHPHSLLEALGDLR